MGDTNIGTHGFYRMHVDLRRRISISDRCRTGSVDDRNDDRAGDCRGQLCEEAIHDHEKSSPHTKTSISFQRRDHSILVEAEIARDIN